MNQSILISPLVSSFLNALRSPQGMALDHCQVIHRIPSHFFSPEYDFSFFRGIKVPLVTVAEIKKCAQSGCAFCDLIIMKANTSWVPKENLERDPLILSRSILDPEQAFGLYFGLSDVSHTVFYRVPTAWRKFKPVKLLAIAAIDLVV
jgi:hypothetical protein